MSFDYFLKSEVTHGGSFTWTFIRFTGMIMSAPVVIGSVRSFDLASQVSTSSITDQSIKLISTDRIRTSDKASITSGINIGRSLFRQKNDTIMIRKRNGANRVTIINLMHVGYYEVQNIYLLPLVGMRTSFFILN